MKKIFTRLLSIGIASCCMLSVFGQEKVEIRTVKQSTLKQSVELRVATLADSAVTYAATGEKTAKTVYTRDEQGRVIQEETLKWENNQWMNEKKVTFTYDLNGDARTDSYVWESDNWNDQGWNTVFKPAKGIYGISNGEFWCNNIPGIYCAFSYGFTGPGWAYKTEETKDSKGNLTRIAFYAYEIANPNNSYLAYDHTITYNDLNLPVLINAYSSNDLYRTVKFEYDLNGNIVLYESIYLAQSQYNQRYTAKYDATSNLILRESDESKTACQIDSNGSLAVEKFYTWTANRFYETHYTVYYPNTLTPTVTTDNNNPIGGDNKGNFDVTVNIPINTISGGSFFVKLPDGFTLDQTSTKLTVDFGGFDMVITKQDDNSWLLEIKPKYTRGTALRSEVSQALAHIAYTVDEKKERGTYGIIVHSIEFTTPDGDNILEPAITVPAAVERWGVGNEPVDTLTPIIYTSNQTIQIQASKAEQVAIFSIMGNKLYETVVQSGLSTINATHFPQGVWIIKGSSGWAKKLIPK